MNVFVNITAVTQFVLLINGKKCEAIVNNITAQK